MTRLGSFERDLDRFAVAHLPNENDLRCLPEGGSQGQCEGWRVGMQFALMDGRFLVAVQELDGVLNGEDVMGLVFVHLVENGGECGRLARTRGASHQHDPISQIDNFLQRGGQIQLLESGDFVGNDAHHYGAASALPKDIYTETRHTRNSIGQIRGAILLKFSCRGFVLGHDVIGDKSGVLSSETLELLVLQLDQLAVHFDLRGAPGRKYQVTYVRLGLEHGRDELRSVDGSL